MAPQGPGRFDPWSHTPLGEHVVEVCLGLSCQEAGSVDLLRAVERLSGVKAGQTSRDNRLTVLAQTCFGRCAVGANARIDGRFCHNLAPDQALSLLPEPDRDA